MFTYVGLLSFTEKGVQGIKDTTKRAAAAREAAKKAGVNIREMLWTMGDCDMVCVLNGTTLSECIDYAPLPLFEACADDVARLSQQPMRFWSSLDRPGLDPVGSHRQQ